MGPWQATHVRAMPASHPFPDSVVFLWLSSFPSLRGIQRREETESQLSTYCVLGIFRIDLLSISLLRAHL